MSSNVIVRFPPSPTGFLHIGNARVALINWLFARKNGGKIILRFDDTDTERIKLEYKSQMKDDLSFLGLYFDEFYQQSERGEVYKGVFQELLKSGFVYECFETEEELEIKRKLLLSKGKPPIYVRTNFTPEQIKNNPPYFRFKLYQDEITWQDAIQGEISFQGKDLSDPVILRANGDFMYTFCSVVDDFFMNVSHIIRGADHITNTAIQIQIFDALSKVYKEKKEVIFAHLPLFQTKDGKISKRVGGSSIIEMRKQGFEAITINNVLSKIGLSYYDDSLKTQEELISAFDIKSFSKSQIVFDAEILKNFNAKYISTASFSEVGHGLSSRITAEFFETMKHNVTFLHEIDEWFDLFNNDNLNFKDLLTESDKAFILKLSTMLDFQTNISWEDVHSICMLQFPDRKGKQLFMPIRLALTGLDHGPEMKAIFNNINPKIIKHRLS